MKYNIHTHQYKIEKDVIAITNQYPDELNLNFTNYSLGIHPWYIDENKINEHLQIIEKNIRNSELLAIGECGLDKRIDISFSVQKNVFEAQLLLAEKYKKPVILHCVAAYQEVIQIKKELKISVPLIIHGFSKNKQVAKSLYDNGFYLSFGKYLLRNEELSEVFKSVPSDKIFLETDTIEETIHQVYDKAKSIRGENIEKEIENNFYRVFNQ